MKNRMMRNRGMKMDSNTTNWAIWGAVVAAAAAGVIYYLNNKEQVNSQLGNLKNKATDALGRARTKVGQQVDSVRSQVQG